MFSTSDRNRSGEAMDVDEPLLSKGKFEDILDDLTSEESQSGAEMETSETDKTVVYATSIVKKKSGSSTTTSSNMITQSVGVPDDSVMHTKFEALLDESTDDESESEEIENRENNKSVGQAQGPTDINKSGKSDITPENNKKLRNVRFDEDTEEIILSLMWAKGHLGAAYYNVYTSELFVMEDVMDTGPNYSITKSLYRQCQSRWVVSTSGTSEEFLSVIKKLIVADTMTQNENMSMSSVTSGPIKVSLKLMPKKENSYENCCHRVQCLKMNGEPKNSSNAERKTFLNSLLNFNCHLMIHALGLLLKHIDANWNRLTLNSTGHAEFFQLNYITLKDLVMIDDDTYKALGIVQSKFHPSLFKFGSLVSKDKGISVFTLLNRCRSRPGVQYLWKLMRHPTKDITVLKMRYEAINFFLDPNNQNVLESLVSCLGHIYRLKSDILNRHSAPQANIVEWSKLLKTLTQVICIADICASYQNYTTIFTKIVMSITAEMHIMRYFIDYIVDFEASKVFGKLVVKGGVDAALDELKHTKQKLPQLLTEAAEKDMAKYKLMEVCRMIYLPDIGYVLSITGWEGSTSEELQVPGLEFKFTIRGVRHYKTDGARELDDTLGDVSMHITKRQGEIIMRVVRYISRHVGPLLRTIEYCAELDTLISFAVVARDYNYVMPNIVESKIIEIKRGRHPLRELSVTFVPNDTLSGSDCYSLVKILTGPNACGKTVYLKQVAIIVFMAHIGSFVPADSAIIGTVTHILTQINSNDSLAQNASSFLLGLRQINTALRASTPNSLVIIDEFGAGTSEIDGLALLTSVLKNFLERGINCPHIFAATHIHRVVKLLPDTLAFEAQVTWSSGGNYLKARIGSSHWLHGPNKTFEYVSNKDNDLVFLHRLINGNTSCSFAHSVAKNTGLDADVVEHALEVFEHKKRGTLPAPLPDANRQSTIKHIMEMLSKDEVNLEELAVWVRQATTKSARKK